jgi:hypothetical protein
MKSHQFFSTKKTKQAPEPSEKSQQVYKLIIENHTRIHQSIQLKRIQSQLDHSEENPAVQYFSRTP